MKKGFYCGLNSRFSNHYYVRLKTDDIQSRCGQINMRMLRGESVKTLKLTKSKDNRCQGCVNLLKQDEEQKNFVEPFRY